jgi:hypothetical protein
MEAIKLINKSWIPELLAIRSIICIRQGELVEVVSVHVARPCSIPLQRVESPAQQKQETRVIMDTSPFDYLSRLILKSVSRSSSTINHVPIHTPKANKLNHTLQTNVGLEISRPYAYNCPAIMGPTARDNDPKV